MRATTSCQSRSTKEKDAPETRPLRETTSVLAVKLTSAILHSTPTSRTSIRERLPIHKTFPRCSLSTTRVRWWSPGKSPRTSTKNIFPLLTRRLCMSSILLGHTRLPNSLITLLRRYLDVSQVRLKNRLKNQFVNALSKKFKSKKYSITELRRSRLTRLWEDLYRCWWTRLTKLSLPSLSSYCWSLEKILTFISLKTKTQAVNTHGLLQEWKCLITLMSSLFTTLIFWLNLTGNSSKNRILLGKKIENLSALLNLCSFLEDGFSSIDTQILK